MAEYFRITAYNPDKDFTVILDSNGKFEALWQFSAYLIKHGFKIIDATKGELIEKVTFDKTPETSDKIYLRAISKGMPYTQTTSKYFAVTVGNHAYGKALNQ